MRDWLVSISALRSGFPLRPTFRMPRVELFAMT
jgi:hypothetical protein